MKKTINPSGSLLLSRGELKKIIGGSATVYSCLGDGLCFTSASFCYKYCILEYGGLKCTAHPGPCLPVTPDW